MKRVKRRGLPRNVAVALGNWGSPGAVPVLAAARLDLLPHVTVCEQCVRAADGT
jgi:epoxyqueuosine reductase